MFPGNRVKLVDLGIAQKSYQRRSSLLRSLLLFSQRWIVCLVWEGMVPGYIQPLKWLPCRTIEHRCTHPEPMFGHGVPFSIVSPTSLLLSTIHHAIILRRVNQLHVIRISLTSFDIHSFRIRTNESMSNGSHDIRFPSVLKRTNRPQASNKQPDLHVIADRFGIFYFQKTHTDRNNRECKSRLRKEQFEADHSCLMCPCGTVIRPVDLTGMRISHLSSKDACRSSRSIHNHFTGLKTKLPIMKSDRPR